MQKIEPAHFEELFEERLRQYDEDKKSLTIEAEKQEKLSTDIKNANQAFINARNGDGNVSSATRDREQALQRLENAYTKYKELVGNIKTGRQFYNDLANMVTRFRDQCRDFAYQRRMEAGQLEAELANDVAMSALNLAHQKTSDLQDRKLREGLRRQTANTNNHNSHNHNHNNNAQYGGGGGSTANSMASNKEEPLLTAPVPTRAPGTVVPPPAHPTDATHHTAPPNTNNPNTNTHTSSSTPGLWNPDMGINFGASAPTQQQQQPQQYQQSQHQQKIGDPKAMRAGQWDAAKGLRFG